MYREKDLMDCLFGLAGWRQNNNPDYPQLIPSLVQSDSGLYFQDDHPLLSTENIDQALKNYDQFVYPDWSALTTYAKGKRVKAADGNNYESLDLGNLNNEPSATPLKWELVNLLSEKLTAVTKASINKVINRIFTEKKEHGFTRSIFENIQLFDGAGSLLNKEIGQGRFVGFEIILASQRDITTIIKRIGTQFTAANPALVIYLFHSSQEAPLKSWSLNLLKSNSFEWNKLQDTDLKDWVLRYLDDTLSPGGSFYLGYYEDGLPGMAINRAYDFANAPECTSCGNNYSLWSQWSQYMTINPIEIASAYLVDIKPGDPGGPKLWDIRKNGYQWTKSFGLNLDLSVRCDVTDFFCRERTLFTDAIIKQVTVDTLKELAYSTRNNAISKETRDLAMFELNNVKPSAVTRLDEAIEAISFDVSDLSEACLPCGMTNGVTWGTI